MTKNPNWQREELILAFNLYLELENRNVDQTNPKVIELSHVLNSLPIHHTIDRKGNFRNPSGVAMKLSNFRRFDKKHGGKGLTRGNRLEKDIWDEFAENSEQLKKEVQNLKSIANDDGLKIKLTLYQNAEMDLEETFAKEGEVYYKVHRLKERNRGIIKKKKEKVLKEKGALTCEACTINFKEFYGEVGNGFIECHHKKPLAEAATEVRTNLNDLALLCPNCHRMIHKPSPMLTVEELIEMIAENKSE